MSAETIHEVETHAHPPAHDPLASNAETAHEPAPESRMDEPSMLSSMLAIIGLVILVVVIVWGLTHLASLSSSWFASLFHRQSVPTISITVPPQVTSGSPFTMEWQYAPTQDGSFALVYPCGSNVDLSTSDATRVPCGTSFALGTSERSIVLTPALSGTASSTIPFTIVFLPTDSATPSAEGSAAVSVIAATPRTVQSAPAPASARPAGPADLSVRIISVTADQYGNGTAVFDIANTGSGSSGTYYFSAQLPTASYQPSASYGAPQQSYAYSSPAQISLAPGSHVVSTLRFTQAEPGGVFSVTVDPADSVNDANRTNNYAYQTLVSAAYPQYNYSY